MSRFFFHFCDGDVHERDEIGLECASAEHAYLEAAAAARAMWPELLAARTDPTRCAFEIKAENGEHLFRLDFAELLDDCLVRAERAPRQGTSVLRAIEETHRRASGAKANLKLSLDDLRETLAEANALMAQLAAFEKRRPIVGGGSSGHLSFARGSTL